MPFFGSFIYVSKSPLSINGKMISGLQYSSNETPHNFITFSCSKDSIWRASLKMSSKSFSFALFKVFKNFLSCHMTSRFKELEEILQNKPMNVIIRIILWFTSFDTDFPSYGPYSRPDFSKLSSTKNLFFSGSMATTIWD